MPSTRLTARSGAECIASDGLTAKEGRRGLSRKPLNFSTAPMERLQLDDVADKYARAASNHAEQGAKSQAIEHYRIANALSSPNSTYLNNQAALYDTYQMPVSDMHMVHAMYVAALRASPRDAAVHNNIALLLFLHMGRPDDAVTHLIQAVALEETNADIHYNIAVIYDVHRGSQKDAIRHYRQAVDLDPSHYRYVAASYRMPQLTPCQSPQQPGHAARLEAVYAVRPVACVF